MFFFEKKNQKTFMSWGGHPHHEAATNKNIKVFCFFSSEKKAFLR